MLSMTHLVLAQATPPLPEDPNAWVAWVLVAAVALLMGLALRAVLKRRRPDEAQPQPKVLPAPPPQPSLQPPKRPEPAVSLPPSELEAQRRAEADALKEKAREQQRAVAFAQEEAEKARLKEALEVTRKEAYRAEKAAEAEARERKRQEREEAQRLEAEAARLAKEEAEAAEQARLAAERKKVEAEAGQTLAAGLGKTRREGFMARLNALFGAPRAIDESVLAELEEVLFTADIGVKTASRLLELARERSKTATSAADLKGLIRAEVARIVDLRPTMALQGGGPPHVVMVVGVNGAGKTTTIGKLAAKARAQGQKVLLGAGDTFRAAATEQLDVWAERAGADIVKGEDNADPASVVFDAVKRGLAGGYDLVLADTAGRLHTKANLMEELKKVRRVVEKAFPGAPHEVLLVLDATNGQNAILQARQFHEAVGVTGIALTKLDGTAKGGVIIGICDELKLPVVWAGVGEKVSDLKRFDPAEFVAALFD